MIQIVDQVVDQDHSITRVPHLMVYSPKDHVIRVDRIEDLSAQMSNAEVELHPFTSATDPAQHVLAGEACSPETTDEMVDLMYRYITAILEQE